MTKMFSPLFIKIFFLSIQLHFSGQTRFTFQKHRTENDFYTNFNGFSASLPLIHIPNPNSVLSFQHFLALQNRFVLQKRQLLPILEFYLNVVDWLILISGIPAANITSWERKFGRIPDQTSHQVKS